MIDPRLLLEAVGDAVVVTDAGGTIVLWNPAAERMFGFPREQAIGSKLDIIIPERLRERHWAGYRETMRSGTTKYGTELLRVPAIGQGGRNLSIAFTVALLKDDAGMPLVAAVLRDETRRFAEERALRQRLGELEARLLAPKQD